MIATFIGHRRIQNRSGISKRIREIVLYLIEYRNVDTFLFGSRSDFDELCLEAVSESKTIKPHINRIYVRAAYPHIDEIYLAYIYIDFMTRRIFPMESIGQANQHMSNAIST